MQQQTIKKSVKLEGKGVHTGAFSSLTLLPAKENFGVRFKRIDLEKDKTMLADVNNVISTDRSTNLSNGNQEVKTVEHLLSALYGLGIDNILIEINGPEVPIFDGSSKPFVNAIFEAGISAQSMEKDYWIIEEPVQFQSSNGVSEIILLPSENDNLEITATVCFGHEQIDSQYASIEGLDQYNTQIAGCRTFVFAEELNELFERKLIKGGNLQNAIILQQSGQFNPSELKNHLSNSELEELAQYLSEDIQFKFPNEPARHKLMDFIGDLALIGKPIKAKIIVKHPGHTANIEFARHLKQICIAQKRLKGKPKYDPTKPPIYDLIGIQGLLPHRYPFLLVDKIIELSDQMVVGIKNITFNEYYFQGHFPGNPVFPGVLQMEALAQTGGILALCNKENASEWDTYFLKMEKVKFKYKVVPGDTIILKMELLTPIRRGIVHMQGTAYVGDRIVSEGELTAQIVHSRKPANE